MNGSNALANLQHCDGLLAKYPSPLQSGNGDIYGRLDSLYRKHVGGLVGQQNCQADFSGRRRLEINEHEKTQDVHECSGDIHQEGRAIHSNLMATMSTYIG